MAIYSRDQLKVCLSMLMILWITYVFIILRKVCHHAFYCSTLFKIKVLDFFPPVIYGDVLPTVSICIFYLLVLEKHLQMKVHILCHFSCRISLGHIYLLHVDKFIQIYLGYGIIFPLTYLQILWQLYPTHIPDLSCESPLIVSGRYRGKFPDTLKAKGVLADLSKLMIDLKIEMARDIPLDRVRNQLVSFSFGSGSNFLFILYQVLCGRHMCFLYITFGGEVLLCQHFKFQSRVISFA